jgi:hypothetical protein
MRPSLYRHGVVFPKLESCFPRNKGLRDKIGIDLDFPGINQDGWSDHQPQTALVLSKIGRQHMLPVFGEL